MIVRILREINALRLKHDNITEYIESFFTENNKFVIVTELAESDLKSFREKIETISTSKISSIMI